MSKLKKIIIIIVVLILILGVIFIGKIVNMKKIKELPQDSKIKLKKDMVREENDIIFFSIGDMIQKIYNYGSYGNYEAVFEMTNKEYMDKKGLSHDNCISVYMSNADKINFYVQEVYKLENYENIVYYIYGDIIENKSVKNVYFKMFLDIENNSFTLEPLEEKEYSMAKNGKIKRVGKKKIEKNKFNNFEVKSIYSKELAKRYFNDYMVKMQYKSEEAYELLDEHSKKEKFVNLDEFKKYINNNKNMFFENSYNENKVDIKEDYREYIFSNQNEEVCKIIVYKAHEYKVII